MNNSQASRFIKVYEELGDTDLRSNAIIGFKRDKAYDLIRRYELIVGISDDKTVGMLEDLPISLTYDISKPSAESTPEKAQAKAEVLAGEITTGKAYKERIKELEEIAKKEKEAKEQA